MARGKWQVASKTVVSGKWQAVSGKWLAVSLLLTYHLSLTTALLASSTSGSGTSVMACAGFTPKSCARTDQVIVPLAALPGNVPALGVPFVEPEFGERMVRATSLASVPVSRGAYSPQEFNTSAWDIPDASLDSAACPGDRFTTGTTGGAVYGFWIDRCTMAVTQVLSNNFSPGYIPLDANNKFSPTDPGIMFGTSYNNPSRPVSQAFAYSWPGVTTSAWTGNAADARSLVYDFTTCPSIPTETPVSSYAGDLNVGVNLSGQFFIGHSSIYGMGQDTGNHVVAFAYNTGTESAPVWKCDWWDTLLGQVGGSDYTGVQNTNWQFPVPAAPVPTAGGTGGTIPAGTYNVPVSIVLWHDSSFGAGIPAPETLPSAVGTVTVSSGQNVTVNRPCVLSDGSSTNICSGTQTGGTDVVVDVDLGWGGTSYGQSPYQWCVYMGTTSTVFQQTCVPWATTSVTLSSYSTTGANPRTVSAAGFAIHGGNPNPNGQYFRASSTDGTIFQALVFWQIGTTNVTGCTAAGGNPPSPVQCGGHPQDGNSHLVNATGYGASPTDLGTLIRPSSNLGSFTQLFTSGPQPSETQDSHYNWGDNNASDTYPLTEVIYPAVGYIPSSDGTQNVTNPVLSTPRGVFNELIGVDPTGKQIIWRYAHVHSVPLYNNLIGAYISESTPNFNQLSYGPQSPDGHFYQLTMGDLWQLGPTGGGPHAGGNWVASKIYTNPWPANSSNFDLITPNGVLNEAMILLASATTAGSVAPLWPTTMGAVVNDNGTVGNEWEVVPGCPADNTFAAYPSSGFAVPLGYLIQDPNHGIEVAQNSGTISGMAPQWPLWSISSISVSGVTVTATLSVAPANLAVGSKIYVYGVSNSTFNSTGNAPTFTVASVSGSTVTWNNSAASGAASGGFVAWDNGTATDSSGITWKMYLLGTPATGWLRDQPTEQCRTDVWITEGK